MKTGTLQLDGDLELGVVSLFGGSIGKAANYLLQQRKSGETETNRQALADVGYGMAAGAGESVANGKLYIDPIGATNDVVNMAIGGGVSGLAGRATDYHYDGGESVLMNPTPDKAVYTNKYGKPQDLNHILDGLGQEPNANLTNSASYGSISTGDPYGTGGTPND